MEFNSKRFVNWLQDKYVLWRGSSRASLTAYAEYLDLSPQLLSNWWNGRLTRRPDPRSYNKLVKVYGTEVYEVLGLTLPGISVSNSEDFFAATKELMKTAKSRGLDPESPAFEDLFSEVFAKHGIKVTKVD